MEYSPTAAKRLQAKVPNIHLCGIQVISTSIGITENIFLKAKFQKLNFENLTNQQSDDVGQWQTDQEEIGWWFGTFLPTDDYQSHEVANHSEDQDDNVEASHQDIIGDGVRLLGQGHFNVLILEMIRQDVPSQVQGGGIVSRPVKHV